MERILLAVRAETPAERGHYAQRIFGVVHNQLIECEYTHKNKSKTARGIIPALWRSTPSGVAALVGDGLASILPDNPSEDDGAVSSLGRLWFAKQMLPPSEANQNTPEFGLRRRSAEFDLRGV